MAKGVPETQAHARRRYKLLRKQVTTLHEEGKVTEAQSKLRLMASQYPDEPEAQRAIADVYLGTDQTDEAITALQNVLRIEPSDRKAQFKLWRELRKTDRDSETFEVLSLIAADIPRPPFLTELAMLHRRAGRSDEALETLRGVVARHPGYGAAWNELIGLLKELGRGEEAAEARRTWEAIPPKLSPAEVVRRIDAEHPGDAERYVVNIGCREGRDMGDPCYELYQSGYPGLAMDAGDFTDLFVNLPQPEVRKLLNTFVTPANVVDILKREGAPPTLSLLKIDIDSFDGVVLEAALREFEPNVIHIEVNPEIPPPLKFAVQYDPRYRHSGVAGFFGCSVAYVVSLCRPLGYELLEVDLSTPPSRQDVMLVKQKYLPLWDIEPPVDERELFLKEGVTIGTFWRAGFDSTAWLEETDYQALLSDVWDACVAGSEQRSGEVLPFILTL